MTPLAVPLVAHFNGVDGKRCASLRIVGVNKDGAPVVCYANRLQPVYGIKDPDFVFHTMEYYYEPIVAAVNEAVTKPEPKAKSLLGKLKPEDKAGQAE